MRTQWPFFRPGIFLTTLFLLLPVVPVHALVVEDMGPQLGLTGTNLETIAVNGLNWVLGLLGLIAVIMVLLGGFQMLISGGAEEQVAAARHTISSAIVGIVVILLSWSLVHFVFQTVVTVTGS